MAFIKNGQGSSLGVIPKPVQTDAKPVDLPKPVETKEVK